MHNFREQAAANGVVLVGTGVCQLCGNRYEKGVLECLENFHTGHVFSAEVPFLLSDSVFLSVDAHALQHTEIYGNWSSLFHLTRLHLMLQNNVAWNFKTSPLLSAYLKEWRNGPKVVEALVPPPPLVRGRLTAHDCQQAVSAEQYAMLITQWAGSVYESWKSMHPVVAKIAAGFRYKPAPKRF